MMGLAGKEISGLEQGFTGIAKQLIPGLFSIYKSAVEEGFMPEQAMVLVVQYQAWIFEQHAQNQKKE